MFRWTARKLKGLSAPALLGVGLLGSVFVVMIALAAPSPIVIHLVTPVGAAALGAMVLAAERVVIDAWGERARGKPSIAFAVLAVFIVGWGVITNDWNRATNTACWQALAGPTFAEGDSIEFRRAALATCRQRLDSPMSLMPRLLGNAADHDRVQAEKNLARIDSARCPWQLIPSAPCTCGENRWPDATGCPPSRIPPTCAWEILTADDRERFVCSTF
jgi:hypothetical protein